MKLTPLQIEYLVARYWIHYYPEVFGGKWNGDHIKSAEEVISDRLTGLERQLLSDKLLMLNKATIHSRENDQHFLYFEWRLEVSGLGARVIEPLRAMDLMHTLGIVLTLAEKGASLSSFQHHALRRRPSYHLIARIMRYIPKSDLPELLTDDHEFIREVAMQRLVDTPDKGTHIFQYRFDGGRAGSFRGSMLSP